MALKPVPKDNKGLKKLPTEVRNKMGFMKKGGEAKAGPKKFSKKIKNTKYSTISAMPKNQQGSLGSLLDKFGIVSNLHRLMGHTKSKPNKGMMIGAEAYGKNVIKKNKGGYIAKGCGQVENSRRKRTRNF